jgi:hypothetical protein
MRKIKHDFTIEKESINERKLYKVEVLWNQGNSFTLKYGGGQTKVFRGTPEAFAKFLQKIKASDNATEPRSKRQIRYMDIVNEIMSGKDHTIWVWDNMMKKVEARKLREEIYPGTVYLDKYESDLFPKQQVEDLIVKAEKALAQMKLVDMVQFDNYKDVEILFGNDLDEEGEAVFIPFEVDLNEEVMLEGTDNAVVEGIEKIPGWLVVYKDYDDPSKNNFQFTLFEVEPDIDGHWNNYDRIEDPKEFQREFNDAVMENEDRFDYEDAYADDYDRYGVSRSDFY